MAMMALQSASCPGLALDARYASMLASVGLVLVSAISENGERRPIELRQRIANGEPRRFRLHQDVPLGPMARIVIEHSGVHLDPRPFPLGIGHRRAASAAKRCAIRRGLVT